MFAMKKNLLVLSFALLRNVNANWSPSDSCDGCEKAAGEWAVCLESSCRGSDSSCLDYFPNADSLQSCCNMDNDCGETSRKIDTCLNDCLPSCVSDTVNNYMQCTTYRSANPCNIEDCITGIVLDRSWAPDAASSTKKFLENLEDDLENTKYSGEDGCSTTEAKATEVCRIGKTCCDPCNEQLGDVMNCVVNEMIRPWMGFSDDCETDCDELPVRKLQESGAFTTGNSTLDKELSVMAVEKTNECTNSLKTQIILGEGNSSVTSAEWGPKAGENFMNCVVLAGVNATAGDQAMTKDSDDSHDHSNHGSSSATNGLTFLSFTASLVALNNIVFN